MVDIREAKEQDAEAIAILHEKHINHSFLSLLGRKFLTILYTSMIQDPESKLFVAVHDNIVVGFICGTLSTKKTYLYFIRHNMLKGLYVIFPKLIKPSFLCKVLETLSYSVRYQTHDKFPSAEVLSMVVAEGYRGASVALTLLKNLGGWFRNRKVCEFRVTVAEKNLQAIGLYNYLGYRVGGYMEVHRCEKSIVYVGETSKIYTE